MSTASPTSEGVIGDQSAANHSLDDIAIMFASRLDPMAVANQLDAVQNQVSHAHGRMLVSIETDSGVLEARCSDTKDRFEAGRGSSPQRVLHLVAETRDTEVRGLAFGNSDSIDLAWAIQAAGATLVFLCGESSQSSVTKVHTALSQLTPPHAATIVGMPAVTDTEMMLRFIDHFYKELNMDGTSPRYAWTSAYNAHIGSGVFQ